MAALRSLAARPVRGLGIALIAVLVTGSECPTAAPELFTLDVTILGEGRNGSVVSVRDGVRCEVLPNGDLVEDCSFGVSAGTVVTLSAAIPPIGGSSFGAWSGAPGCTASPICQVTMDQHGTVGVVLNP